MDGIDYNVIFQDYLEDVSRLRLDVLRAFTKVRENSSETQRLLKKMEAREADVIQLYKTKGHLKYSEPPQLAGKLEKDIRSAINKSLESQARLNLINSAIEYRLRKMDHEALTWDPATKDPEPDPLHLDPTSMKLYSVSGEKRKASGSSASGIRSNSRSGRAVKKGHKQQARHSDSYSASVTHPRRDNSHKEVNATGHLSEKDPEGSEDDDRIYCFCLRESFGDMVCCDNNKCPHEWFHYECVGLTEPPNGAWYCFKCAPEFTQDLSVQ